MVDEEKTRLHIFPVKSYREMKKKETKNSKKSLAYDYILPPLTENPSGELVLFFNRMTRTLDTRVDPDGAVTG